LVDGIVGFGIALQSILFRDRFQMGQNFYVKSPPYQGGFRGIE